MATRINTSVRNACANAVTATADAGPGPAYVEIRTGAQPATPATAASGTLLGTLTCSDPSFGAASNGVISAAAITGDSSADATGTAGWYRLYDSTGAACVDGTVTAAGGGGDMIINNVSIVAGGTISITSWTITMPGA